MKYLNALLACLAALPAQALETAYLAPSAAGVTFTPIMNVGDAVGRYRLAGVPDGLGAYDNRDGSFTLLLNHELKTDKGIPRDHGGRGAFVSRWVISKSGLRPLDGGDMVKRPEDLFTWNAAGATWTAGAAAIGRLCSADLAAAGAFRHGALGYDGRIFLNGEENGDEGRAFAWVATGSDAGRAYELPRLGKLNWENAVASPHPQNKTIVMAMDDDGLDDSGLYVYVGAKQAAGNAVERAGLHNGKLYGVRIDAAAQVEDAATAFGAGRTRWRFSLTGMDDVTGKTGARLEADSRAAGISQFRRVEDGAWDTQSARRFYFVTTADFNSNSRLWRLTFKDLARPELGGVVDLLLDGGDGVSTVRMMDNIAVDEDGNLLIQEDPGNQSHLAGIWRYHSASRRLTLLARHDAARFGDAGEGSAADYQGMDEESSGVTDVTALFRGVDGYDTRNNRYFILTSQAHAALHPAWTAEAAAELVEAGQLLLMKIPRQR